MFPTKITQNFAIYQISFQGNKFFIGFYSGTVTVIRSLDFESVNNYTLKIIAKVSYYFSFVMSGNVKKPEKVRNNVTGSVLEEK